MSMLNHFFDYKPEVLALDEKAMELCQPYFRHMEEIRDYNQLKMLKAFADTQMSSTDMLGTTGYGLWVPLWNWLRTSASSAPITSAKICSSLARPLSHRP